MIIRWYTSSRPLYFHQKDIVCPMIFPWFPPRGRWVEEFFPHLATLTWRLCLARPQNWIDEEHELDDFHIDWI